MSRRLSVLRVNIFLLSLLFSACAIPLSKTLPLDHPPRLGIIGFKITAPINELSSIAEAPQAINPQEESILVSQALRKVEDKAMGFFGKRFDQDKQYKYDETRGHPGRSL